MGDRNVGLRLVLENLCGKKWDSTELSGQLLRVDLIKIFYTNIWGILHWII